MNSNKTILIVDDHDSIRMILGSVLGKTYNVVTKKDGIEALAWFRTGNIPDLILLDMLMPRLDGIAFLRNIRSSGFFKDIPVLVVSGKENSKYIDQCNRLGVDGYLTKPFNPQELREKIGNILNSETVNINE